MLDFEPTKNERKIYTISEFNAEISQLLLDHVSPAWLEGEISNLSRPASGHIYFTLKDAEAQIRCAMFRGRNRALSFKPESGMQVTVHARADLYAVRGDFQLIVNFMEISGHGELQRQFEQLKHKLDEEGLFDQSRKQPLPKIPKRVGVITSKSGAALHDVLTTLNQRFPAIEVFVYPTLVQGDEAPNNICRMLEVANQRKEADVLILARGGGSLEDLWAFNEERVARAIAASALPIITGIGHEVDFTIADFVADNHAPTPTAAAQHVSPDRRELARHLVGLQRHFESHVANRLAAAGQTLALKRSQLLQFHPETRIERWMQRLDDVDEQLHSHIKGLIRSNDQRLTLARMALTYQTPLKQLRAAQTRTLGATQALNLAVQHQLESHHHRLERLSGRLNVLSPFATLKRGYSLTTDEWGRIVRSINALTVGKQVKIRIADGHIDAAVKRLQSGD